MSLQKQPYALQFQGGFDSKTDGKQVGYTKLLDLQNAVFTKNTTLVKRNGYKALGKKVDGSTSPYASPAGLGARDDELLLFADANAYSHRPSSDTWSSAGAVSSVKATSDALARTGTHQNVPDAAYNGGITVAAWEDSRGGVWAEVLEGKREILAAWQLDAAGKMPRCVAVGSVLHVYWVNGNVIWGVIVNPSNPSVTPTSFPVATDLDASHQFYDAISTFDAFDSVSVAAAASWDATTRPALMAWASATGIRISYIHESGVLGSAVTKLPVGGTITATVGGPIAVDIWTTQVADGVAGDPSIAVVYADGSGNLQYVGQDGFALGGGASVQLSGLGVTWNRVTCAYGGLDASSSLPLWWAGEVNGATADVNRVVSGKVVGNTVTANTVVRGHCLATRAFYDAGDVYCGIVHAVQFFPYVAIVQLSGSMRVQARLLPGLSSGILTRGILPSVYPVGLGATGSNTRQHAVCLGYRIQLSGTSGTQFGEVGIQLFTLDFVGSYQVVQLGRGAYLSGAILQHYDGSRWAEADFHCAPDTASGTIATTLAGGGSLTTGQWYAYRIIYEEIDAQGELHPGAACVMFLVQLTGGNTSVVIAVPTYRLTGKRRVRIGVFRSKAASSAPTDPDLIPFYRVSSVDPNAVGANGYLLNDTTVDSVSFTDHMSDATASGLEPAYFNGGILSNDPPAFSGTALAGGKQRLFWADPTDPHLVWFSQQLRDDTAVEMSAALNMRTDPYGGSVVGIGVMDDSVYALKDTAIYVTEGPGPDADGGKTSQNAFAPWALVTSDVGCKSAGSICQTPLGIAFQSSKGIKLLGRDRQVVDIGADVYAYNDQTIVRATLLPDRHQVVFLTDSGSTLLWDYLRGQWSRFTNHEGLDAVVVSGTYHYLRNDGRVFQETIGKYADDNMHIPMVIETAWIKMAGYLQGWQKVLWATVVGEYKSSHQLQVRYRIDYQAGYTTLTPINVDANYNPHLYGAGLYGAGSYGGSLGMNTNYQQQVHINRRCQAISFQFSDVEGTTAFGSAFELSELLLTGGVLGAKFPAGAARST